MDNGASIGVGAVGQAEVTPLERQTIRKVVLRIVPFVMVCYLFAIVDRVNIGVASLQMNKDLGLSPTVFGFAASLYFWSYFLFEVPSNLALQKYGARLWLARIMISWGLLATATALVSDATTLCIARLLLGAAEAGFFPGVVLYLTYWLPSSYRARYVAWFMVSIPAASFLGSPLSGALLHMDSLWGLRGWHWLFILEGLPTILLGIACLFVLTDRPEKAAWLSPQERDFLSARMTEERAQRRPVGHIPLWKLLCNQYVLAMALVCAGASGAGSTLGVWQPQLIKALGGLSNLETSLLNAIPFLVASVLMVFWGRHSDRTGERRWHTAISLLMISGGMGATFLTSSLAISIGLLCVVLVGAYSFKGPFWALSSGWLSAGTAAAGLAAINATSNLIGGGIMVNLFGVIKQATGSYSMALLPQVLLTLAGAVLVLVMSRKAGRCAN
jgi:MFS family permease